MKKLIQILTVAFGLSMLTAYVVYSQLQQNPRPPARAGEIRVTGLGVNGTQPERPPAALIAPGSKSAAIITPPAVPALVAPGSKSKRIVSPEGLPLQLWPQGEQRAAPERSVGPPVRLPESTKPTPRTVTAQSVQTQQRNPASSK